MRIGGGGGGGNGGDRLMRARRRRGATMVEYSIMLGLIAVALALAVYAIGVRLKASFASANAAVIIANSADDTPPAVSAP